MIQANILLIMLLAPLIGALTILVIEEQANKKNSLYVALWISCFVFFCSLLIIFGIDVPINLHNTKYLAGITSSFNNYFSITTLTAFLTSFTASLVLASFLVSIDEITYNRKIFSILVLLLESICIAIFTTTNIVVFYIGFEAILIPMFLIIGINGRGFVVARKFFICLLIGSLFLLFPVIYILSVTSTADFSAISNYSFSNKQQIILFISIFVGLAFKTALFPFHIWLPDTHTLSPTSASIILSGIFLKVGCYGFLIFFCNVFCSWNHMYGMIVCTAAAINVLYGCYSACIQESLKRMIAYMSISHIGVILIGVFSNNVYGVSSAVFQMVSHGITSCGLFVVEYIIKKYKKDNVNVRKLCILSAPIFLSGISFPFTSNFIGEFGILINTFNTYPIHCIAIIFSEFLCIFHIFKKFKDTFFYSHDTANIKEINMSRIELRLIEFISSIIILGSLFGHKVILYTKLCIKDWIIFK